MLTEDTRQDELVDTTDLSHKEPTNEQHTLSQTIM